VFVSYSADPLEVEPLVADGATLHELGTGASLERVKLSPRGVTVVEARGLPA